MPGVATNDAWQGTLKPESVRVTQLEPGNLLIDRSVAQLSSVRFVSCSASVGYEGHSDLLPGRTVIGVIADPSTDARWFGKPIHETDIVQTQTSMDLTTHGHSNLYFAAIDSEKLEPNDGFLVHRNSDYAHALRHYLGAAIRISNSVTSENERLCRGIEGTLLPLLALSLSETSSFSESSALRRRVTAVRKCEAYVREHIVENPTLAELSAVSGLRIRSLINAFQAVIGMSPMTYLRVHRLNEVHKSLLELDPSKTRVIEVAATWGFWHMGHFTESYREMFGELPSQTLNRRARVLISTTGIIASKREPPNASVIVIRQPNALVPESNRVAADPVPLT